MLYPHKFPFDFLAADNTDGWTPISIRMLEAAQARGQDPINFPKCRMGQINPYAIELTGGIHGLSHANGCITYMAQLDLDGNILNRGELLDRLQQFPEDLEIQYRRLSREPPDWDRQMFGPFQAMTFVRCHVPPSNKSAGMPGQRSHADDKHPVIAVSQMPSSRLGLRFPYNRILDARCFKCPSLNGSLSFCKHLSVLLVLLSFPREFYRSTGRCPDFLNTVASDERQVMRILPPTNRSANIPANIPRRSANTRTTVGGIPNPLYDFAQGTMKTIISLFNI